MLGHMIRICCQDQLATPGSVDGSSGHFATNYFKRTFLGYTCVTTWHVTARSTYTPQFDSLVVSVYSASFRVISVTSPNTCATHLGPPWDKLSKLLEMLSQECFLRSTSTLIWLLALVKSWLRFMFEKFIPAYTNEIGCKPSPDAEWSLNKERQHVTAACQVNQWH